MAGYKLSRNPDALPPEEAKAEAVRILDPHDQALHREAMRLLTKSVSERHHLLTGCLLLAQICPTAVAFGFLGYSAPVSLAILAAIYAVNVGAPAVWCGTKAAFRDGKLFSQRQL